MLPDLVSFYSNKDLTLPEKELHTQPSLFTAISLLLSLTLLKKSSVIFDTRPIHQKTRQTAGRSP